MSTLKNLFTQKTYKILLKLKKEKIRPNKQCFFFSLIITHNANANKLIRHHVVVEILEK